MNFRYILRIFTLLFLFHSVILVEAAHAQRWNVFGRIYEVESLWMEEALNKESNAQVHLVRSDLIKRHHGIRVKLISDSPRPPTIAGGVWKTEEPSSQPAPTVSLSIFDRNQKAFIDQPGTQSLPSVVGKSETIHMSEFWGAQNYGPLLFHFYDSDRGHCSKIVIVISGGKQRTREKMKERLHAGLQYIKETSESEYSSDLSPPSDGTHHDPDGAYSSSDSEVENQRHKRKLDDLRRSQEKALEQLREQQKRELDEFLRGQERQQLMQQQPSSQELNNYSEPPYELWQDSELYCPNAPIKFIDMLEQDWFTPLQLQDSPSSFDLLDSEREPPLKRPKLESGPEVQDSAGGQEERKEIKEETVDALNLFQLDEDLLYELDDMEDIPSSQKPLTL